MNGQVPATYGQVTPYVEYDQARQRAWSTYVMIVERAQTEYLAGQYPDRAAYINAEGSAWLTYHAATRGAYQRYVATISPRPAPPPAPEQYSAANLPIFDSVAASGPRAAGPTFTETSGGDR